MILAIDTSMAACSVCVLESGSADPVFARQLVMERGHAEALMPMVQDALAGTPGGASSLLRIAVSVGPGSFTGIRVGVAAARGLALALGVPAVGVSTFSAFAAPAIAQGSGRVVAAAIDARHGQVYLQAFDSRGLVLLPPRLAAPREGLRAIGAGELLLVGSGARLLAGEAPGTGSVVDVLEPLSAPDIVQIARLGLLANPQSAPARPFYLKPPDAKPVQPRRLQSSGV